MTKFEAGKKFLNIFAGLGVLTEKYLNSCYVFRWAAYIVTWRVLGGTALVWNVLSISTTWIPWIKLPWNINTFSDVVISCCCKRLRSFPLKHRIFYPKQILSARNHCYKFKMNDTSEVNGSLKNESQFARSFPSKADGIVLCSAYLFSSALIITGNLFALVLFAVTKAFLWREKGLFLVMNMAFADLLLGTFSVPFYINFVGDA